MLVLSGIVIIVAGFLLRFNPLLVVLVSAMATGLAAGIGPLDLIAAFGKAFNDSRYVTVIYMVLPVIGLLERHGLQERARTLIAGLKGFTVGRLLLGYLAFRQITAALGLVSVAGHAQTVRPLVAPMAEAAAQQQSGEDGRDEEAAAMAAVGLVREGEGCGLRLLALILNPDLTQTPSNPIPWRRPLPLSRYQRPKKW